MSEAVRVQVELRLVDVLEANRWAREQRLQRIVVLGLAAFLAATGLLMHVNPGIGPDPTPVLLSTVFFGLLGLAAPWLAGLGAWLLRTPRTPATFEIGPAGVTLLAPYGAVQLDWRSFRRWFTTPNLLVLVGQGDTLIIPRRCCERTECDELEAIARSRLGEPSSWYFAPKRTAPSMRRDRISGYTISRLTP